MTSDEVGPVSVWRRRTGCWNGHKIENGTEREHDRPKQEEYESNDIDVAHLKGRGGAGLGWASVDE